MKASKRLRKIINAQKPPKKYLIDRAKSVRGQGLVDKKAADYFLEQDDWNQATMQDLKMAKSTEDSHSHDMSISIDVMHQKQITEYEEEQDQIRKTKTAPNARNIEMNLMQHTTNDAKRASTHL
eukprot:TRINITY_DN10329_c0_g1_i1.p1 TRINITY_DN10329_c0_g1~~TRINITY_DN10329_c0_g1_i1.p1  ORF type:complete len:124 (-),score=16.41 TRINITY_DN10329_c0_g1_i1:165-536(-)